MQTPAEVLDFFQTHFPDFGAALDETEAQAFLDRPVSQVTVVECDRFHHGDRVLILGDAAHAVSPSIGQGCNAALQDVGVLNGLLDRHDDDWSQVLREFSQQRVPEAHALRQLADHTFPRSRWLRFEFFLRLAIARPLHKLFPQWFPPFIFDAILQSDRPYSEIFENHQGWIRRVRQYNEAHPEVE